MSSGILAMAIASALGTAYAIWKYPDLFDPDKRKPK